jgi:hypothetical protein
MRTRQRCTCQWPHAHREPRFTGRFPAIFHRRALLWNGMIERVQWKVNKAMRRRCLRCLLAAQWRRAALCDSNPVNDGPRRAAIRTGPARKTRAWAAHNRRTSSAGCARVPAKTRADRRPPISAKRLLTLVDNGSRDGGRQSLADTHTVGVQVRPLRHSALPQDIVSPRIQYIVSRTHPQFCCRGGLTHVPYPERRYTVYSVQLGDNPRPPMSLAPPLTSAVPAVGWLRSTDFHRSCVLGEGGLTWPA